MHLALELFLKNFLVNIFNGSGHRLFESGYGQLIFISCQKIWVRIRSKNSNPFYHVYLHVASSCLGHRLSFCLKSNLSPWLKQVSSVWLSMGSYDFGMNCVVGYWFGERCNGSKLTCSSLDNFLGLIYVFGWQESARTVGNFYF